MKSLFPASAMLLILALLGLSASSARSEEAPTEVVEAPATPERAGRPVLPRAWHASEFEVPNQRYTLEVARFPSAALAGGVRIAFENLGWGPLQQVTIGNEEVILLGNFGSVAYAIYAARDLEAQKVATPRVVVFPPGVSFHEIGIEGPLIPPFYPSDREDARLLKPEDATRQVAMLLENLPERLSDSARVSLEQLAASPDWSTQGGHVATVAAELHALRVNAPLAFFLARRVASRQWSAPDEARLTAGEITADLQYGWLRDWRGAWASTVALLEDPARDPVGRTRDRLRLSALEVDLAASALEPKPNWNRIRLQLRRAWDEVPLNAEREQAKIELIYLQTFAWQGNWARVEELGKAFVARHSTPFPHEAGLAKLTMAKAMERREAWEEALALLDRHFAGRILPPHDGLYMGFERLDLDGRYREARRRLVAAQIGAEAEAIAEKAPLPSTESGQ